MKIITWNAYSNKNKNLKKNLRLLIYQENPEILCIQEFPKENLAMLNSFNEFEFKL